MLSIITVAYQPIVALLADSHPNIGMACRCDSQAPRGCLGVPGCALCQDAT
jgi:hypothetical protein